MIRFLGYEEIPLDQLETFPGNANVGDVPRILESLRANGAFRSLIVRKEDGRYTVMAGNHTKLAMVEHGAGLCGEQQCGLCGEGEGFSGKPRCELFDCSDDDAIRINLADNRIAEFGHRDDAALSEFLMSLEDLSGSGYTADDLRRYLPQDLPVEEELPERYEELESEPEPIWPTLSFKVSPAVRDRFLELTSDASDPSDQASRFLCLIGKAHG